MINEFSLFSLYAAASTLWRPHGAESPLDRRIQAANRRIARIAGHTPTIPARPHTIFGLRINEQRRGVQVPDQRNISEWSHKESSQSPDLYFRSDSDFC